MLEQRRRQREVVSEDWGPRAMAEVLACRRDPDARTAVILVLRRSTGWALPAFPDLVALRDAGLVAVECPDDVDFADPGVARDVASFVCLLRDCTGLGVPVLWGGTGADAGTVDALAHLHPPCRRLAGPARDRVAAWRESFRPGRFSWRRGPGFVVVDDRRAGRGRRVVIGDRQLLEGFEQLAAPVRESAATSPAIRHLAAAGLTVQVGPWLVGAPHRLRP